MNIKKLLIGLEPAGIQTVGVMSIIPLISDLEDNNYIAPERAKVSTRNYGQLVFNNQDNKKVIVPVGAAYIVKEAAQNHGMVHAGVVKEKAIKEYNTAACIQQTQGGSIRADEHEMFLLPWYLKEYGFVVRSQKRYAKIWNNISSYNKTLGINASGHLEHFYNNFKKELEFFTAEFEPLPKQVGAIILMKGNVVGIERVPNYNYWRFIFNPLIRQAYGSLAIQIGKGFDIGKDNSNMFRVPINTDKIENIDELSKEMRKANKKQSELANKAVRELLDDEFHVEHDETESSIEIEKVENNQFIGQYVKSGEKILYVSLASKQKWLRNIDWIKAKEFNI